jgi:hypothetical protein
MSFVWLVFTCINGVSAVQDIVKNDYSIWFYITLITFALSIWLYSDARKTERRQAEAKRQLINVFINTSGTSEDDVAKRAAEALKTYGRDL